MQIWRILAAVSLIVFIVLVILLSILRLRKNVYFKKYVEDQLFKKDTQYNTKNEYYLVMNESRNYIRRYVLRRSAYEKSVVFNFNKPYKSITYFVVCYGKGEKIIDVREVKETNTNNSSKIITISKATQKLNVVIKEVEGLELNTNMIKPLPMRKIQLHSILSSVAVFSILFTIRHVALELILGNFIKPYFEGPWNAIGIIILVIITLIYYFSSVISLRIRNGKNNRGGAQEYEFF